MQQRADGISPHADMLQMLQDPVAPQADLFFELMLKESAKEGNRPKNAH